MCFNLLGEPWTGEQKPHVGRQVKICEASSSQSVTFRFRNFSVSKLFNFFGGFGFNIKKIWHRKKYRFRYRKNLVSEKVSDSVSLKFGIGKSFGLGFVQILGILGEVSV